MQNTHCTENEIVPEGKIECNPHKSFAKLISVPQFWVRLLKLETR